MMKRNLLISLVGLGLVSPALAEMPASLEGGLTAVVQVADDSNVESELLASFDLLTTLSVGKGQLVVYVEGNTTPQSDGVANLLSEANGDAGSALDRDGKGRLQVSELQYVQEHASGQLVAGLLDVTSAIDGSEVASDETTQFVSGPLTGNPTIGSPDYSLGASYTRETSSNTGYSLALTSSHGLADNPNASYAELLDVGDDGKGLFAIAEGQWPVAGKQLHVGVWVNTADHVKLGTTGTEENYGLYISMDGQMAAAQWNVRAGLANENVSQASHFASLAMELPYNKAALGLGLAYTGLSSKDATPQLDDTLLAEAYMRFQHGEDTSVTPAIIWLSNSGFDASSNTYDADQLLVSLRLNYTF